MLKTSSLVVAFLLALAVGPTLAADDRKAGKEQARRLQQQQQKISSLEQEKAQLIQEKSQLEEKLKGTSEQVNRTKRSVEAANRKGSELDNALKKSESEKAELVQKLAQSEQKLAETAEMLSQTQESKSRVEAGLASLTGEYSACTTKNESLHGLGVELIKQYQQKSCLKGALQSEPLTKLKSVDAENMLEEYRDKLDQERVNQQLEERQKLAQQQTQQEEQEQVERLKAEQQRAESLKAKQQNKLDRITGQIKKFFDDLEW